jgi:hypothetical protein
VSERFLRPRQVATEYELPRDLVYEALRDGRLRHLRRGKRYYTTPRCVESWIRKETKGA